MRLLTPRSSCPRGETLASLLVGMAVSLIVLAGGMLYFSNNVSSNRAMLQTSRLDVEMMSAMDTMVRETRRAQYVAQAQTVRFRIPCNDAFCDQAEDFLLADGDAASGFERIEFSYDRNDNGVQDVDECAGFRVSNGRLEMKTSCASATLAAQWSALTDEHITRMTGVRFKVDCTLLSGFNTRLVTITLDGQLARDPQVMRQMNESVQVRATLALPALPAYCSPT